MLNLSYTLITEPLKTLTHNVICLNASCTGKEFLSQYKVKIIYIKGKDNCVANTHSWLPENCSKGEHLEQMEPHEHWKNTISAILSIKSDCMVLVSIKSEYNLDPFCICLEKNDIPGTQLVNGLWYVSDHSSGDPSGRQPLREPLSSHIWFSGSFWSW